MIYFMFAEALIIGTALLALLVLLEATRRVVLRNLSELKRGNDLLAIDRHRPDTVEEVARVSRAQADQYALWLEHEGKIANLTLAVAEGIAHVKRAEKRVQGIIQGARKSLEERGLEHPGLEAEAQELLDLDGDPSEVSPLRVMPAEVGEDEEEHRVIETGIPGYSYPEEDAG